MTIYHKHHIIPRHAGGTDDPSNLVELTVEEHALAHKKLWEEHGRWQDKVAWLGLAGIIGNEELFLEMNRHQARENNKRLVAEGKHNLIGNKNPVHKLVAEGLHHMMIGDNAKRMALKRVVNGTHNFIGHKNPSHIRMKDGTHNFLSDGFRQHQAKAVKEKQQIQLALGTHRNQIVRTCPHCNKTGIGPGMFRYHFDRCKLRSNT